VSAMMDTNSGLRNSTVKTNRHHRIVGLMSLILTFSAGCCGQSPSVGANEEKEGTPSIPSESASNVDGQNMAKGEIPPLWREEKDEEYNPYIICRYGEGVYNCIKTVLDKTVLQYVKEKKISPYFLFAWSHGMDNKPGAIIADCTHVYYFDIYDRVFDRQAGKYKLRVWKAKLDPSVSSKRQAALTHWQSDAPFGLKIIGAKDTTLFYVGFHDQKQGQWTGDYIDFFSSKDAHYKNSKLGKLVALASEYVKAVVLENREKEKKKQMNGLRGLRAWTVED
jgi:hypothetical protein